ncbi:hypothetical protein G1H11_17100 [Phytoactinopolyspora alkaliphila]|uniref:DUF559 domain-containing protein n=1 Tax=Phytoactinopolyspora alkaliphila TaxID=1783498 RepID=A0A6N9YPU3_9ACTN|nr:hypothetical protein [Phytoactinopolyspora alkaliphila]NED97023.1 hypothetical protein [Phytoactinopolyspora alkaliphila]
MVSGASACRAYGIRYIPDHAESIILVPDSVRRVSATSIRMRRVSLLPEARMVGGIPTAPPERAVIDTCRGMTSLQDVRAVLCEAAQRGLTTPERLICTLGAARWKGSTLVRRALDDLAAGCRSAPECELRDLVRRSRFLDEPRWNQVLPHHAHSPGDVGSDPSMRPDACWPNAWVVVEIDSAEWHRYGDRVEQTERRRARYAALGWTVLPVSPRRLREEPDAVLREIEAAVAAVLARTAA